MDNNENIYRLSVTNAKAKIVEALKAANSIGSTQEVTDPTEDTAFEYTITKGLAENDEVALGLPFEEEEESEQATEKA